jgi:hypothetical protein
MRGGYGCTLQSGVLTMDKIKLALFGALILAGCGAKDEHPATVAEKPVPYAVPTLAPCLPPTGHAIAPQPLNQRYPADQWAKLAPGAKGQAVAAQGGARLNYEDEERGATAGCK